MSLRLQILAWLKSLPKKDETGADQEWRGLAADKLVVHCIAKLQVGHDCFKSECHLSALSCTIALSCVIFWDWMWLHARTLYSLHLSLSFVAAACTYTDFATACQPGRGESTFFVRFSTQILHKTIAKHSNCIYTPTIMAYLTKQQQQ